jgi:hypothetical protein
VPVLFFIRFPQFRISAVLSDFPQSISLPRRFALHILFCRGIFLYAPSPTPLLPRFIFLPRNNFCSILCLPRDILYTNSDSPAGRLCFRGSFLPRDFFSFSARFFLPRKFCTAYGFFRSFSLAV